MSDCCSQSSMFLHFSRCTDYAFFLGFIVMFLACVSFCYLGLSVCLSFLLLSFRFNFCSFRFLFCFLGCSLRFLEFLGVAWLVLACLGVSALLSLLLCWLSCLFCFLAF